MTIAKEVHNKSYMKRFRVKYRRRRECKTNYRKRARLVSQYKNKYGSKKYRLVVRKSNRDMIVQIFSSDMTHDVCLVSAYSHELARYGIPSGLTNYAAAYCTGLLVARRLIEKLGKEQKGTESVDGDFYLDEESGAFKAYLDTGLSRCSTGANIFGVLKGAVDGGLNIPHNTKRFPGSSSSKNTEGQREWEYDPEQHRARIFGAHITEYMRKLQNEDEEKYKTQFSKFIEAKIGPDDIESMYRRAHEKIRAKPTIKRGELEKGYFCGERSKPRAQDSDAKPKSFRAKKLTGKEKKMKALEKLKKLGEQ